MGLGNNSPTQTPTPHHVKMMFFNAARYLHHLTKSEQKVNNAHMRLDTTFA